MADVSIGPLRRVRREDDPSDISEILHCVAADTDFSHRKEGKELFNRLVKPAGADQIDSLSCEVSLPIPAAKGTADTFR